MAAEIEIEIDFVETAGGNSRIISCFHFEISFYLFWNYVYAAWESVVGWMNKRLVAMLCD